MYPSFLILFLCLHLEEALPTADAFVLIRRVYVFEGLSGCAGRVRRGLCGVKLARLY